MLHRKISNGIKRPNPNGILFAFTGVVNILFANPNVHSVNNSITITQLHNLCLDMCSDVVVYSLYSGSNIPELVFDIALISVITITTTVLN